MSITSPDSGQQPDNSPTSEILNYNSVEEENGVKAFKLLQEISPEVRQEMDLIDAIVQAPSKAARKEAIEHACKALGKHQRSIMRKIKRLQEEGITS